MKNQTQKHDMNTGGYATLNFWSFLKLQAQHNWSECRVKWTDWTYLELSFWSKRNPLVPCASGLLILTLRTSTLKKNRLKHEHTFQKQIFIVKITMEKNRSTRTRMSYWTLELWEVLKYFKVTTFQTSNWFKFIIKIIDLKMVLLAANFIWKKFPCWVKLIRG